MELERGISLKFKNYRTTEEVKQELIPGRHKRNTRRKITLKSKGKRKYGF